MRSGKRSTAETGPQDCAGPGASCARRSLHVDPSHKLSTRTRVQDTGQRSGSVRVTRSAARPVGERPDHELRCPPGRPLRAGSSESTALGSPQQSAACLCAAPRSASAFAVTDATTQVSRARRVCGASFGRVPALAFLWPGRPHVPRARVTSRNRSQERSGTLKEVGLFGQCGRRVTGRPLVRPSAADDHSVEGIGDRIDCQATHCSDYLCFLVVQTRRLFSGSGIYDAFLS
jgi:hypothetical protein